jgi:hypothetical protein
MMLSERFPLALKAFLGMLPLFYGGMIIATMPNTLQWAVVVAVVLVTLLVLVGWLGLPLQTIWPIFPAAFLIVANSLASLAGGPSASPITDTPGEVTALYLVAALYFLWGARATWKATHIY